MFPLPVTGQDTEAEIVTASDPSVLVPSDVSAVALDFKVLHPVVITKLGVFPRGARPELQSNVTVKLLQLGQEVTGSEPLSLMYTVCCLCEQIHSLRAVGAAACYSLMPLKLQSVVSHCFLMKANFHRV